MDQIVGGLGQPGNHRAESLKPLILSLATFIANVDLRHDDRQPVQSQGVVKSDV